MSKIIAHQTVLDGGARAGMKRAQFTDYMAHNYRSSKHGEIGLGVRRGKGTLPKRLRSIL